MTLVIAMPHVEAAYHAPSSVDISGLPAPAFTPKIRKKYKGSILFTQSEGGQLVPIRTVFTDLQAFPSFNSHVNDFVAERAREPGKVYLFEGTFMVYKNGKPSFSGTVSPVNC